MQYRNSPEFDGPIGFFADVAQWSFVYKNMIYMLQTLVGDGVVVRHCVRSPSITLIFNILSRFIVATSSGNRGGSLSFPSCYGFLLQVSRFFMHLERCGAHANPT